MLSFTAAGVAAAAMDTGWFASAASALAPESPNNLSPQLFSNGTTLTQTVLPGSPNASGYRKLITSSGEAYTTRAEITTAGSGDTTFVPIAAFGHISDLHIIDDQSPARVEFLDRYNNDLTSGYPFDAAYRPHEFLSTQIVDAMCRAIKNVGVGPQTGIPLTFTIMTGDAVDNAQLNETRWYIDLLDGGKQITPNSGNPDFDESVSNERFGPDTGYWHPEKGSDPGNYYRNAGFLAIPGLLGQARKAFTSTGLGMPWYAAYGNHDVMMQGNVPTDTDLPGLHSLKYLAVNQSKPYTIGALPAKNTDGIGLGDIISALSGAEWTDVTADATRRLLSVSEFVGEHFTTSGLPSGHGFTQGASVAYYSIPAAGRDPIQYITLDSTNPDGGITGIDDAASGSIDSTQFNWLQNQLKACSSRYLNENDDIVNQPGVQDKLIVVFCHHPIRTMTNTNGGNRHNGDEVRDLLLRFPNVILMANGHTHRNSITPHFRPTDGDIPGGFWEVSAAAHIDWPVQSRVIEIATNPNRDAISIFTAVIDIDAPLSNNGDISNPKALASLARELAVNDTQETMGETDRRGAVKDRNTRLLLQAPFALPSFGAPVAVTRNQDGRLQAFAADRSANDNLLQSNQSSTAADTFASWSTFGGHLQAIAAGTDNTGRVFLAGAAHGGSVVYNYQTTPGGSFSGWITIDGLLNSIALGRNADGRMEIFGCNSAGQIFHRAQAAAGDYRNWGAWSQFDGLLTQVAVTPYADGRLALFGVNKQGSAFRRWQLAGGGWSAWAAFTGSTAMNSIAAATNSDGRLEIFATDLTGQVFQRFQQTPGDESSWTDWVPFNAQMAHVAANTTNDGRVALFGYDFQGHVWKRLQQSGGGWTNWTRV
jgi:metallophosphoesterase (TIGR03767 family)